MDRQAIADAVTRGLANLDDVTNAITDQIVAADTSPNLDRATSDELLAELAARLATAGTAPAAPASSEGEN